MLYVGRMLLGYTEWEVWRMPLGKIILLYREYKEDHGMTEAPETQGTIEDLIPRGIT